MSNLFKIAFSRSIPAMNASWNKVECHIRQLILPVQLLSFISCAPIENVQALRRLPEKAKWQGFGESVGDCYRLDTSLLDRTKASIFLVNSDISIVLLNNHKKAAPQVWEPLFARLIEPIQTGRFVYEGDGDGFSTCAHYKLKIADFAL